MGLTNDIDSDLKQAFDTDLADAVSEFEVVRKVFVDDDWLENGSNTTEIKYSGRGVFSNFSQSEIDGNTILNTDVKLICLQSEVTDMPKVDDLINQMQVVAVAKDPVNVSWTVQLRKV